MRDAIMWLKLRDACKMSKRQKNAVVFSHDVPDQMGGPRSVCRVPVSPGGRCQGRFATAPQDSVSVCPHATDGTAAAADMVRVFRTYNGLHLTPKMAKNGANCRFCRGKGTRNQSLSNSVRMLVRARVCV